MNGAGVAAAILGGFSLPIFTAFNFLARSARYRAQRHGAASGTELSSGDARPLVLYLRSFGDEALLTGDQGRWRLEQFIVEVGSLLGPVVAIGRPGEGLPYLGAARDYVSNDEWQKHAQGWMENARAIFLVIGGTASLGWEAGCIAKIGALSKTVFVLPPLSEYRDRIARWNTFLHCLVEDAPDLHRCFSSIDSGRLLAFTFTSTGEPVMVWTGGWDAADYNFALTYALGVVENGGDPDLRGRLDSGSAGTLRSLASSLAALFIYWSLARVAVFYFYEKPRAWRSEWQSSIVQTPFEEGLRLKRSLQQRAAILAQLSGREGPQTPSQLGPPAHPLQHQIPAKWRTKPDNVAEFIRGYTSADLPACEPLRTGWNEAALERSKVPKVGLATKETDLYYREAVNRAHTCAETRYPKNATDQRAFRRGYLQRVQQLSKTKNHLSSPPERSSVPLKPNPQ